MKKFWWILIVILVIAAIAIFAFRPSGDKAPAAPQESAAAEVSSSGKSTAPAAEKPQASTAPAQENTWKTTPSRSATTRTMRSVDLLYYRLDVR